MAGVLLVACGVVVGWRVASGRAGCASEPLTSPAAPSVQTAPYHTTENADVRVGVSAYSPVRSRWLAASNTYTRTELALMVIHPWNMDAPDGPKTPPGMSVFLGTPKANREGHELMAKTIAPFVARARKAGVKIIYVMPPSTHALGVYRQRELPLGLADGASTRLWVKHSATTARRSEWWYRNVEGFSGTQPLAVRIHPSIEPLQDDIVVYDDQLGQLVSHLNREGVNTLLYSGFAANLCIQISNMGMVALMSEGFDCILVRDATMAVESDTSVGDLSVTRATLDSLSHSQVVFTSTKSVDFQAESP